MIIITSMVVFIFTIICISHAIQINEQYIEYYYYSVGYENNLIKLNRCAEFSNVVFDVASSVKIICHAYKGDSSSYWIKLIVNNYVRLGVKNIVVIDWSKYSMGEYIHMPNIVQNIGKIVGKDLLQISTRQDIPLSNFHLIGHSLGAHISGFAGKYVNEVVKFSENIGRITGLDPAGPLFLGVPPTLSLAATDGSFVDVIHTTAFFGYSIPLGRVDFWVNGGLIQPKCTFYDVCGHTQATELFAQGILSGDFISYLCANEKDFNTGRCKNNPNTLMGEHVDLTAVGSYFLKTKSSVKYFCSCP